MNSGPAIKIPHILLLEDDRAHQDLIVRAFRDDPEQYRVSIAGTLRSAREILEQDPADLIIADWILPDGKGLDILPRTDGIVTIPVIIMTSFGDEHLAVEIMKSGAIDYVVKSATMFADMPHIARRARKDWENIHERQRAEEAVRNSQKRLADILSFLPDAVLAIDNDGRVIAWNDAIARMTGVAAEDMLGKADHEYSIPFYGERRPILIDLILLDDKEVEKKYDFIQRDGNRITSETYIPTIFGGKGAYLWGTASPLFNDAGERSGAIEVIRDITERKQNEDLLRQREATLKTLLNSPHDTIALLDREGIIIDINEEGARRLGGTVMSITGRCAYDLLPAEVAGERKVQIDRVFVTGVLSEFDDFRSGMYLHNEIFPVFNHEHTSVDRIAIFARDITDKKRAELALQESEKRFRTVLQNVPSVAVQGYSIDGTTQYWNEASERFYGYSPEEALGKNLLDLIIPPEMRSDVRDAIRNMAETGQPIPSAELSLMKKGGSRISVYSSHAIVRKADGTLELFCIDVDMTERKRVETALRESETRFKDLFNNMGAGVAIYEATPDGKDFIIRDINRAVETIEHVTKNETIGRSILEVFPGVAEFGLFAVLQRVATTGIAESHPISMYRDNRISGWRENYVYRLPSGEVVALYEDVTEKKQAEEAEQETSRKYAELFELGSEAIFLIDNETGAILEANAAACEMYGYSRDVLLTLKNADLSAEKEETRKVTAETPQGTIQVPLRYHRRSDGTVFPVEILGRFFVWNKRPVHIASIRDITSRIHAEEQLRESNEFIRNVLTSMQDGLSVMNLSGEHIDVNPSLCRMTGFSREELIGTGPPHLYWAPEVYEEINRAFDRTLQGEAGPFELVFMKKDGTRFPVLVSPSSIRANNGQAVAFVATVKDITLQKLAEQALRESELRYRSVIENASEGICVAQDAQLQYVNPRLLEMIDMSHEEITGHPFTDFIHPDDRGLVLDRYQRRVSGENVPQNYDFRVLGKNMKITWVQLSAVRIEWNNRPATLNFIVDITERKQMEETLQKSEQEFRSLAESMPQIVWVTRADGWNIYFNQQWVDYTGLSLEESYGHGWNIPFHPDDRKRAWDAWQRATQHNDTYSLECRLRRADGLYRWWLIRGVPLRNASGETLKWFGTCTDIENIKQAEEKIKESETRFRALIQNSSDIIRILDRDGLIIYESPSAERILGYPSGSLIGKDPRDYIHPDDFDRVKNDFEEVVKGTNHGTPTEFRIRTADETYIWVDSIGVNLLDTPGVNGIVITTRPIQQRKLAEEQINTTIAQLERSEALLRKVYDILPIGLWLADKNGKLLYGNPAGIKIWGAEPLVPIEEYGVFKARHYPSGEEIAPDDWALAHTILGGVTIKDELLEIDAFDGKKKIIVNYTAPLYDSTGAIDGAIIVNQEITDRVSAEQALKVSGERLSLALEATSDGLWDWDLATDHVFWSHRAFEMLGYAPDEFSVNFAVWKNLLHPDDREATEKNVMTQLHEGNRFTAEFRYRMKDGSWMWILGRGRAVAWDAEGKVTRMVGTHVDLTSQKMAERALRDNQARLATAMDIAGLVNWEYDVRSGMFTFDDRFYALYDTTAEREGGNLMSAERYLQEFVYPEDRQNVLAVINKLLATTDPDYSGQMEHRITPRDGSVRTIIARFAPVMGPDGTVIRTFGANQDITDFKLMESEIRSLNTVLEQRVKDRTEALVETNEKLEEENAQRLEAETRLQASYDEKVMLLKEIHHRVKNNLQIIASLLNLQSRYISDPQTLAAIRESQNRVKAMALVHEKLYRADDISHISLQDYIRFLGTGLFQFYDAKIRGIQFTLEITDINVDIDSAIPLGLILNELISNSLKYAFPEGTKGLVTISVKKEDHTLTVIYRDTGIGIPADLDWRNTPSLGLRLVTTLVDQMNGTVELDRRAGTLFTMVLHEKEPRRP